MIVSLLYLTTSRPNIIFIVCLCARLQSCPKKSHLAAIKCIFKYLHNIIDLSLWYPRGMNFKSISYSDVNFIGSKVDRKSTSGTCHPLGNTLVSWFNKKQISVAIFTTEAEYIVAGSSYAQTLWMQHTLKDYSIILYHSLIMCDNMSAINLSKNLVFNSWLNTLRLGIIFLEIMTKKGISPWNLFLRRNNSWIYLLNPLGRINFPLLGMNLGY